MLLERGDFTTVFIETADSYISNRYVPSVILKDAGRLGGMLIRENELNTILTQTWSALAASQDRDEDFDDEILEAARRVIRYSIVKPSETSMSLSLQGSNSKNRANLIFSDIMLATPTSLLLHITAPHDLFVTSDDASMYSSMNSYLLSIRRTILHISHLWRLRMLRMFQNVPWSTNESDSAMSQGERITKHKFTMRAIWTVVSEVHFFFSQLGLYLQGEVVRGCTNTFHEWLRTRYGPATITDSPSPTTVHSPSYDSTAKSLLQTDSSKSHSEHPTPKGIHGPATEHEKSTHQQRDHLDLQVVIEAHKKHIGHLYSALLLDDASFTTSLHILISRVEHLVALFSRLETVIRAMQISGSRSWVAQSSTGYAQERSGIITSINLTKRSIRSGMRDVLKRLATIDEENSKGKGIDELSRSHFQAPRIDTHKDIVTDDFVPWRGVNLSHLLMRIEMIARK